MKVIDLLNKKANNEKMPFKVKYKGEVYNLSQNTNWYYDCKIPNDSLGSDCVYMYLNNEVEIIEEDKEIEELEFCKIDDDTISGLIKSINELNDEYVHKMNELVIAVNELNKGK